MTAPAPSVPSAITRAKLVASIDVATFEPVADRFRAFANALDQLGEDLVAGAPTGDGFSGPAAEAFAKRVDHASYTIENVIILLRAAAARIDLHRVQEQPPVVRQAQLAVAQWDAAVDAFWRDVLPASLTVPVNLNAALDAMTGRRRLALVRAVEAVTRHNRVGALLAQNLSWVRAGLDASADELVKGPYRPPTL